MLNRLWQYVVSYLARRHGFLDPITLLARLDRLGQPAEVRAPLELLRAGALFHARGLVNSRVIQNNLDWVWPYWVQRQFDPEDDAFMPRGFAVSHVNLTLRNWTAVGLPGCQALPIVDPRGLVTPFFDGWSLDACVVDPSGRRLVPSGAPEASQSLEMEGSQHRILTETSDGERNLCSIARVETRGERPVCRVRFMATGGESDWLVVSLRPYNPEGVSFVHELSLGRDRRWWQVNGSECVEFDRPPERHATSEYSDGDVLLGLLDRGETSTVRCRAGLASAAALFPLGGDGVELTVPLEEDEESRPVLPAGSVTGWDRALEASAELEVPDPRFRFLYESAVHSLVLLSPREVYPGPYTYKRFWFRDAAFMTNALLCAGLSERARRVVGQFPENQRFSGFFYSQDGEWDSNGEALWILWRFCELTGSVPPPESWIKYVRRGARWIGRKRTPKAGSEAHAGLLPAGFSAEHLGNNDYYYWDDFWAVAGLQAAARMCDAWDEQEMTESFEDEAQDLMECIERSLDRSESSRSRSGVPASPYRRMDGGAVGSLVASYPLQLWEAGEKRIGQTIGFLRENFFLDGGFFHQLAHSGINAYLTLHIAQVMLRRGEEAFIDLVETVAELASPTGQWPEAIHPRTNGGCMGDGQHGWAAAEWVVMMRNMFVREEGDKLVLCSGIPRRWLNAGQTMRFGPAPTPHGPVEVAVEPGPPLTVRWDAEWRGAAPRIEVRLPGCEAQTVRDGQVNSVTLTPGT
jgi:hypothetical protein